VKRNGEQMHGEPVELIARHHSESEKSPYDACWAMLFAAIPRSLPRMPAWKRRAGGGSGVDGGPPGAGVRTGTWGPGPRSTS